MRRERGIAPGRRAFYRRFEDELLGYFLTRGATPAVAADMMAEAFAAALPSRSRRRLLGCARETLDASRYEGRVVAVARGRSAMPPVVLTQASLARIAAAADSRGFIASEVRFEDDDRCVRVVDESDSEEAAAGLRLSDAIALGGPPADPRAEQSDMPRIPELEDAFAVAVGPRDRHRARGVAVVVAAAAALAFLVIAHGNDGDRQTPGANTSHASAAEREIAGIGNTWANAFAASGPDACVLDMTATACRQPVSLAVKQSFRGATVEAVNVRGRRAAARFSNGEIVEFVDGGPHTPWQVHVVATGGGLVPRPELAPEDQITRDGNEWARLFASSDQAKCNPYMTQPTCERLTCRHISGPIENCDAPTLEFLHSFYDSAVRDVVVKGTRAAAKFDNGEIVDFLYTEEDGGAWLVAKLGRNAGRLYHEHRIVRDGNAWAQFFAATTRHCVDRMTPRACEQVVSAHVRRSFRRASVEAVVSITGRRARARFSNGALVEFRYVADAGGRWWVDKLRPSAGG